jgi:hypothetical protein
LNKVLLLDFSITDEIRLYQKIFIHLKKKYIERTETAVKNMNYRDFGIPKKWGLNQLKIIPKQVQGAMLYNYLLRDIIRPGDGILLCQIIINPSKLRQYADSHPTKTKYQLPKELITQKLNVISFPPDLNEQDFKEIQKTFIDLDIKFDLRTILDFNVDMKLDQFQKIFKEQTRRLAM